MIVEGSSPSPGVRLTEMRPASGPSGPGIYWLAPGVSVGERRQPFELEVGGSIPLGGTLESTPSRCRDTSTPLESASWHRFSGVDSTLWPTRQGVPSPAPGGFDSHRSLCLFPGHVGIVATAESERSFEWYSGFKSQWEATGSIILSSLGFSRDWTRSDSFAVATKQLVTDEPRCCFARNSQVQILSVATSIANSLNKER